MLVVLSVRYICDIKCDIFVFDFIFTILFKGISFVKTVFEFNLFCARCARRSAERVRLSCEAANAEVVQSKVVLSHAFSAWEPSIPILPGVQSRSKTWGCGGGSMKQ